MWDVPRLPSQLIRSDFARLVAHRFGATRLLLVGAEREQLSEQCRRANLEATVCTPADQLAVVAGANGESERFDLAIWLYAPDPTPAEDERFLTHLSQLTNDLVLVAGQGDGIPKRRPQLVAHLRRLGFFPDYECDLSDFGPGAFRLVRKKVEGVDTFLSSVETAFDRLNLQICGLQRTLRTRMSELEAADRHIAKLEEKLLKLKEYRRQLKELKADKQALRKSPERRIGQVLLAPYRLPQKALSHIRRQRRGKFEKIPAPDSAAEYQRWFERHRISAADVRRLRSDARKFHHQPLISVIAPVFNTSAQWLEEAVSSVVAQVYENWELLLVDDGSTDAETLALLPKLASRDPRITLLHTDRAGISGASNHGIAQAKGEWLGLLDHDDMLEPDALLRIVELLDAHPNADLIYSDEDKLTEHGLDAPLLKPDWSPDFFQSCNYIGHFTTLRRALVQEVGGFRSAYDFAQDYDLYLRIIARTQEIHHVPRVLYHWRRTAASTADNIRRKPETLDAGRRALADSIAQRGERGHVTVDWGTHLYRVRRELTVEERVAIIIPTRDQIDLLVRCIRSITTNTTYRNYEIIVVNNDSHSEEARDYFSTCEHGVLHYAGPFNFSAMNNFAVEETDARWLLFLNNDVEVIDAEWLWIMAEHVQRREVGAVGAQLLYPDNTVQHAGVVLGTSGIADHAFRGFPADYSGANRQLQVTRNYSAVTAACMLTRREVFEEVGGFDEERLPVAFNDVDLCLKMRRAGYLIVYTPFARLYHHESASRRRSCEALESDVIRERWPDLLERDPYYNPSLSRERADFSLGK